jgi:hypothetical protein
VPSQARLRELFDYHPDGYFIRKMAVSGHWTGEEVRGSLTGRYLRASVDGRTYLFHRLVFKWHHGECPAIVDHYPDRDRANCRIENLRSATHSESMVNRGMLPSNTTGIVGISPHKGRFRARRRRGGVPHYLGLFNTVMEAGIALEEFDHALVS